jgi:predicted Zn-dependent peptidase
MQSRLVTILCLVAFKSDKMFMSHSFIREAIMDYSAFGAMRQAGTTASGIRVVVYHIPSRPIAIVAAFDAGSRYDPTGLESLAHVAEHMVVSGTKELATKDKIAAYIEKLGGSVSAYTSLSTLAVELTIGSVKSLQAAVYLLNQLFVHSRYDEVTFKNEVESVRQELASRKSNPDSYVSYLFRKCLLSGTALCNKIIDSESAINRVNIDDVRQYAAKQLVGYKMVIAMAGGITLEQAISELDRGFELSRGSDSVASSLSVELCQPTERVVTKAFTSSNQVQLMYGFAAYGKGHSDAVALDVLTKIIGGGRASSLSRRLRYERGLVYSVQASSIEEIGFGYWRVRTSTDPDNIGEVIRLVNGELERAVTGKITQDELDQAKAILINSAPLRLDAVEDFLDEHIEQDLYAMPEETRVSGWIRAVCTTTLDDITRVARNVFVPQTSLLTLCGDIPEAGGLTLY